MLAFYTKCIRKNYCIVMLKNIISLWFEIGRFYLQLQFDKNGELLMCLRNYEAIHFQVNIVVLYIMNDVKGSRDQENVNKITMVSGERSIAY